MWVKLWWAAPLFYSISCLHLTHCVCCWVDSQSHTGYKQVHWSFCLDPCVSGGDLWVPTYELKRGGVMSWNFLKLGICDGPQGGSWCPNQQDRNILWYWPVESGHTNRVPTDLLYVEMGGGGFLRCAMKATLIDVKANVENFFQIKAHLKKFQFSVCHHIWGHYE